jgi:hypothetical protein
VKKIDEVVFKEEEKLTLVAENLSVRTTFIHSARFNCSPPASWPFKIFNRHWKKNMSGKAQSIRQFLLFNYLFIFLNNMLLCVRDCIIVLKDCVSSFT